MKGIGGNVLLRRSRGQRIILIGLMLLAVSWLASPGHPVRAACPAIGSPQTSPVRKINAPYFEDGVRFSETAVFWFGQVTPNENSADARIGYDSEHLYVRIGIMDRRLWYDPTPSPDTLTDWDAVALYLDTANSASTTPQISSFLFDAQLNWWEARDGFQAVHRGNGSSWASSAIPFTTTSGWRGTAPNNQQDDRAWAVTFRVPFESLGLTAPPVHGSLWRLAVVVHDRDTADGALSIPEQVWPETATPLQPSTWGQLHFGLPIYTPPPSAPGGTTVVRQGLDGATVIDADVGGSTVCGGAAWPDYFPAWGELNYAGQTYLNVQNLGDIGDWPCFSRTYVTFPLDTVPANSTIVSATLTMYQFGNAGEGCDPGPQPSLIQISRVDRDWDESTLTWNNSPLALENVAASWADVFPELPGQPREWDVSGAVSAAYQASTPLRLALYESDWAYHSGKYFWSSEAGEWEKHMRPTLTIAWGRAIADLHVTANPSAAYQSEPISFEFSFLGTGNVLTFTNNLPPEVSAPTGLSSLGTATMPVYSAALHRLTWSAEVPLGQSVTLAYTVTVTSDKSQAVINTAQLQAADGQTSTTTATVIANPEVLHMPLALRFH